MKIIFLGDIIGKVGRKAVTVHLPVLKKKYKPDIVIANAENLAHGIGFTRKTLDEMTVAGVDFFTSGNHAWKKAGADEVLNDKEFPIIRPENYADDRSGVGYKIIKIGQKKLLVVNLLGQVFISDPLTSPFKSLEKILKKHKGIPVLVDFHAEATSEKVALAQYFDGKVSVILGTHTHVPTCDQRVLNKGTGFVTDVGMIGYYDSVIGSDKKEIFKLFLDKGKASKKHDLPEIGDCQFNAMLIDIDGVTRKVKNIQRLDTVLTINS